MKTAAIRAIEHIEREFHRRAFGDERARVNAMPLNRRKAYLERVQRRSARTGAAASREAA